MPINSNCVKCNKPLKGRADKKFCNDDCRNNYNNQLKFNNNDNYVRNINNALGRNRRILQDLINDSPTKEKVVISKQKLVHSGFQFLYQTHNYTNKKGTVYHFCYDYGYLPLDNGMLLLVKGTKKEQL